MRKHKLEQGYSVVEILTAVVIMSVLMVAAFPIYIEMQRQAAISSLYSDVSATVIETTVLQNFDLDDNFVLTEETFNSYKTETSPNIITLHSFTVNNKTEYCVEGLRTFADIGDIYVAYNISVKEYIEQPCSASQ
jgi:prepilin-type N-terminal cleavage/methylation domain-containing protein